MHYGRLRKTGSFNKAPYQAERFWDTMNKTNGELSCWEWSGGVDAKGYGRIKVGNRPERTHRFAWKKTFGEIPKGMLICHTCDNPPCCNPKHLYMGTVAQNNADKMSRGRHKCPKGEKHPKARFTEKQILEIRRLRIEGRTTTELAIMFKTRDNSISRICLRQVWKHI